MALKHIAPLAGRRRALRTSLGVSAIQQIDGFEIARREVTTLRDTTRQGAAVTTWNDDGPITYSSRTAISVARLNFVLG